MSWFRRKSKDVPEPQEQDDEQPDEQPDEQGPATMKDDGSISLSIHSLPEAKLAIKQLKLWKKELGVIKRQVAEQQRGIRSEYTDQVRQQASKFRGGGGFGQFVRAVQTANRDHYLCTFHRRYAARRSNTVCGGAPATNC